MLMGSVPAQRISYLLEMDSVEKSVTSAKMFSCNCQDYEWKLNEMMVKENLPLAILSEMAEFRRQATFRFGLRNSGETELVSFSSINHRNTGIKILLVTLRIGDQNPVIMTGKKCRDQRTQMYWLTLSERVSINESLTLTFRIYVEGSVPSYGYKLSDELLNIQLWSAAQNGHCTDVQLVVGERVFPVHKIILAARSPVFNAMFSNAMTESTSGIVNITDVDPDVLEQLLRFMYTGELHHSASCSKRLAAVADKYQVETLQNLCQHGIDETRVEDLPQILMSMRPVQRSQAEGMRVADYQGDLSSVVEATELRFYWRLEKMPGTDNETTHVFKYQNEKAFHVGVQSSASNENEFTLYFFSTHHHQIGFNILDVKASMNDKGSNKPHTALQIERWNTGKAMAVEMYCTTVTLLQAPCSFTIQATIEPNIENFCYHLSDKNMGKELWAANINLQLTDIEFFFGDDIVEAHRFFLVARSPVFLALLATDNTEAPINQIEMNDIEKSVFVEFLFFLYTGTLQVAGNCKKLLAVAEKYQVETLRLICEKGTNKAKAEDISATIMMAI